MNSSLTILLIENDPADARFFRELLREAGAGSIRLVHGETLRAACQRLAEAPADIVSLDALLPESTGVDTLRQLQTRQDAPLVILTGLLGEAAARHIVGDEAYGYPLKERLDGPELVRTVRDGIARHQARKTAASGSV